MIPEQIPTWFYVVLVVALALTWLTSLTGSGGGNHKNQVSGVSVLFWSIVCVVGLVAATLWWRGVLFGIFT